MKISDINFTTTKVEMYEAGTLVGSATGFFFRDQGIEFLATNRHVVIDEESNCHPDTLKILLHASRENLGVNLFVLVSLYRENLPLWLQHPNYSSTGCDVVLVPLDKTTLHQQNLLSFRASQITHFGSEIINKEQVNPFGEVAIVGYPLGFHDMANNLPIYRRASIASSYGVEFNGKPYFLVDANLHPGTSGSPVVSTHHTLFRRDGGRESYCLFGINSAQHVVDGDPLGLNVVWYANLLPEIARQSMRLSWEFE